MPRSPWLASAGCTNIAGGAGGRQRGGDLAADVAALAHAHHHHAAAHVEHGLDGAGEVVAGAGLQPQHGRGLDVEGVAGQLQGALGVEWGGGGLERRLARGDGRHPRILEGRGGRGASIGA